MAAPWIRLSRRLSAAVASASLPLALACVTGCSAVLGYDSVIIGECFPGERRCSGNTAQACDERGQWREEAACLGQVCREGACRPNCEEGNEDHCTDLVSITPAGIAGDGSSPPYDNPEPLLPQNDYGYIAEDESVSADGRFVAFVSSASDLVPGDKNGQPDVFVRDMDTGVTTRISVAWGGGEADGPSSYASISADGKVVAFTSQAGNLVGDDMNGEVDAFVRDLAAGQTEIVSVVDGGDPQPGAGVYSPVLSTDGRFVAFTTTRRLVAIDDNDASDIYVRDRLMKTTTPASVNSDGEFGHSVTPNCWNGSYTGSNVAGPPISGDGRYITFMTGAGGLAPGDNNGCPDVFLRDMIAGTTIRVSVSESSGDGIGPNSGMRGVSNAALSADGSVVVFAAAYSNLVPNDTNKQPDIFVRDIAAGTTTRLNMRPDGTESSGNTVWPGVSADGRYVTFLSYAADLVPNDTNEAPDAFVADRTTGLVERTNVTPTGAGLDAPAVGVTIAEGGSYVVFTTTAQALSADQNQVLDVYRRRFR